MDQPAKGRLFLIPVPLGEEGLAPMPAYLGETIAPLQVFIAERAKTARHWIKALSPGKSLPELTIYELNEHTDRREIGDWLVHAEKEGKDIGLMSEAGCPGVADPGAEVVALAHQRGLTVVPLVGPSSLLLALMASGLNGQRFCFHGYLPPQRPELARTLKQLEQESARRQQTQIFIETPYRNRQVVETALKTLAPGTLLCIASNLTLPDAYIRTRTIAGWNANPPPDLHKAPAVFLILGK